MEDEKWNKISRLYLMRLHRHHEENADEVHCSKRRTVWKVIKEIFCSSDNQIIDTLDGADSYALANKFVKVDVSINSDPYQLRNGRSPMILETDNSVSSRVFSFLTRAGTQLP
ncbi:hypothetical protein AgCh_025041 [Apium graveolens]